MILAAGLSPAWQQILLFDQLQIGEVNRALEASWCASGKVLNVAIAAHGLSRNTRVGAISPLGGKSGESIGSEFRSLGISLTAIATEAPTRVCTTILDRSGGLTTELVENSPSLTEAEWETFLAEFQRLASPAEICVFTGSLPGGRPADFLNRLHGATECRWLLDVRGNDLLELLSLRPWLVKPNREELSATLGRDLTRDEDLREAMRGLIDLGAGAVLITCGAAPALLGVGKELWRLSAPSVPTVNPIGCGDSLAGGIAVAASEGAELVEAVRFGIAAAANNAELLLPARLDRRRVEELVPQVRVERVE